MLILSESRLVRESLGAALIQALDLTRVQGAATLADALVEIGIAAPTMMLIDASLQDGPAVVRQLHQRNPRMYLIVFGVDDAGPSSIAWNSVGMAVRVSLSISLKDLIELIRKAAFSGPLNITSTTPPKKAGHINGSAKATSKGTVTLTMREEEVAGLIMAGESNKGIARLLNVSNATVKSHVHNLLNKLGLERRGKLAPWHEGSRLAVVIPRLADRSVLRTNVTVVASLPLSPLAEA